MKYIRIYTLYNINIIYIISDEREIIDDSESMEVSTKFSKFESFYIHTYYAFGEHAISTICYFVLVLILMSNKNKTT